MQKKEFFRDMTIDLIILFVGEELCNQGHFILKVFDVRGTNVKFSSSI